jgi:hypothetical protein
VTLLALFPEIVAGWRAVFPQPRTFRRAVRQALGSLVCLGRRCLTRIIWTWGGQDRGWSGGYFLHSRCQRQPQDLFAPLLRRAPDYCPGRLAGVAVDDTLNLKLGLRFLQASL